MKKILFVIAMVVASMMYSAVPTLAEDGNTGLSGEQGINRMLDTRGQKDECLIVAKNCVNDSDDVMHRVERLRKELDKGVAAYTPEELKILNDQLNWIYLESDTFTPRVY